MQPIGELISRIRWDAEFGAGYFEVAYADHVSATLIRVPLRRIEFEAGNHFAFQVQTPADECRVIPFHRVRAVLCTGGQPCPPNADGGSTCLHGLHPA